MKKKYNRYKKYLPVVFLWAALFVFPQCEGGSGTEDPDTDSRTILVYMGGEDRWLAAETFTKIDELRKGWGDYNGRLVVFQDSHGNTPRLVQIYRNSKGENAVRLLREYTSVDMQNASDPAVFASVLEEVRTNYASDTYGLIFFSHGTGWLPEGTYKTPSLRSVGLDGTDEMEIWEFASVIPDGMFDFIILEACLMSGVEVAWELKEKADYIVASSAEIVSPGFSKIYADDLKYLFRPVPDLDRFVRDARDYQQRRLDSLPDGNREYYGGTFSLIETAKLPAVAQAVANGLRKTWEEMTVDDIPEGIQDFGTYRRTLYFDFVDYYSTLMDEEAAAELKARTADCVIGNYVTDRFRLADRGFYIASHSGLTAYIPQTQYPNLNQAYKNMKWYQDVISNLSE